MRKFVVDDAKCNRCGLCVIECSPRIIEMKGDDALPSWVDTAKKRCIDCGHCVAVCAPGAAILGSMKPEDCAPITRGLLPTAEQVEHFLKSRRSIRAYKEKPVPRETLAKLIDIARYAPSGHNSQPLHWLVFEDPAEVKRLAGLVVDWMRVAIKDMSPTAEFLRFDLIIEAWGSGIDRVMRGAPHAIVAHAPADNVFAPQSSPIALTYLELAAYGLGLGACWAGYFQAAASFHPPMQEALQLPEGHISLGAMMIGYPKHRFSRIPLRKEPPVIWR